jgi:head-tail adaptor
MNIGKLDTRVLIKRLTKTADTYGGFTSTQSTASTIWAAKNDSKGDFKTENGKRSHYDEIEIIVRKKTADTIQDTDLLKLENEAGTYRINSIVDTTQKYYTTIKATKIK